MTASRVERHQLGALAACRPNSVPRSNDVTVNGSCGDSNHTAVNHYFKKLPLWPKPADPGNVAGTAKDPVDNIKDGRTYSCTTTPYTLTTNPDKIVMFAPDVATLWPGAIVQGKYRSTFCPSHGENRGSSPLGSANKINDL